MLNSLAQNGSTESVRGAMGMFNNDTFIATATENIQMNDN